VALLQRAILLTLLSATVLAVFIATICSPSDVVMLHAVGPLAFGDDEDRTPTHGYEPRREAAMAAFAKSWRRE